MPAEPPVADWAGIGRFRDRWCHVVFALLLSVGVAACTTGFVYNRLHWVASWYVNGLVSLEPDQEAQLRGIVERTLDWHRGTQLPQYLALLGELNHDKDGAVTPELLERRYQQMMTLVDEALQQVLPDAASLLGSLSMEQIDELAQSLEEDNEELWEEYSGSSPEARQKRRARTALRVMQRFTGSLNRAQRSRVEERLATMHDVSEQWMERRRHWQARFLEVLRDPPPGAGLGSALRDLALDPNRFDAPDYRARVDENRRITLEMLADLLNSLDARQRAHLGRKYDEYAKDIQELMNRD